MAAVNAICTWENTTRLHLEASSLESLLSLGLTVGTALAAVGFGAMTEQIGNLIEMLGKLADTIPKSMRPDWADTLIDKTKQLGKYGEDLGKYSQDWGIKNITDMFMGNLATVKWAKMANDINDHWSDRQKDIANSGSMLPTKLAGAFDNDSKEAYHIVADYVSQGRDFANQQQQQIEAIKKGNELLQKVVDNTTPTGDTIKIKALW